MKYTSEITLDKVITLLDNLDNLAKWQPELVSFEHLQGETEQPGG